jgi:predicted secreted protein
MDGTGLKQVTTGDNIEAHPTFSPDGRLIACQSYGFFGAGKPYSAIAVVPSRPDAPTKLDGTAPNFIVNANHIDTSSQGRITAVQHMAWR